MKATLADHAKAVAALVEKDPGYARLFELSSQARTLWAKADRDLIARVEAMDDPQVTRSRKATEGCADET